MFFSIYSLICVQLLWVCFVLATIVRRPRRCWRGGTWLIFIILSCFFSLFIHTFYLENQNVCVGNRFGPAPTIHRYDTHTHQPTKLLLTIIISYIHTSYHGSTVHTSTLHSTHSIVNTRFVIFLSFHKHIHRESSFRNNIYTRSGAGRPWCQNRKTGREFILLFYIYKTLFLIIKYHESIFRKTIVYSIIIIDAV